MTDIQTDIQTDRQTDRQDLRIESPRRRLKSGFEITNSNLSNMTNLILLDSLLQEVTAGEM